MDGITKQTRRQSYDGIRPRSGERCKLILETLGNRSMTVEEITDELVAADYGAPTTRKRWYAIFRRDGKSIIWPEHFMERKEGHVEE